MLSLSIIIYFGNYAIKLNYYVNYFIKLLTYNITFDLLWFLLVLLFSVNYCHYHISPLHAALCFSCISLSRFSLLNLYSCSWLMLFSAVLIYNYILHVMKVHSIYYLQYHFYCMNMNIQFEGVRYSLCKEYVYKILLC